MSTFVGMVEEALGEIWECRACGLTKRGNPSLTPDPCLGKLPGVIDACCGHGVERNCGVLELEKAPGYRYRMRKQTSGHDLSYGLEGKAARQRLQELGGNPAPFDRVSGDDGESWIAGDGRTYGEVMGWK